MAVNDASDASLNSFLSTIFTKIAASSDCGVRATRQPPDAASLMTMKTASRRCDVLEFGNVRKSR